MANHQQSSTLPSLGMNAWFSFLLVTFTSIFLNLALHNDLRSALVNKYPNDSFYTLSVPAAIGLALITTTLLILILIAGGFKTNFWIKQSIGYSVFLKGVFFLLNMLLIIVAYQLFLVIAPQIFYTYYQFIFLDLPVQWVIKPITVDKLLERFSLRPDGSIADHLASFTLWVLIFNTAIQWLHHTVLARHRAPKPD